MKKILLVLIIIVIAGTASIIVANFFKKQAGDRALAAKEEAINNLRCPNCNVILIGIDTLRADHLSSYGYYRDTSPNIDKFAENGVLFRNTFSASSKTTPSFMSIFTSLYPTDHGVLTFINPNDKDIIYARINDSVKTMAQILKEQGYTTQALVGSPQLPPEFGFDKGFDNFEINILTNNRDKLLQWLKGNKDKKYFVFFHDLGAHDPYAAPKPYDTLYDPEYKGKITTELPNIPIDFPMNGGTIFDKRLQQMAVYKKEGRDYFWSNVDKNNPGDIRHLEALYDGEIKYLDEFIGELQKVLLETNVMGNTIIIFTADHGEEFLEHGDVLHRQVYNEILKVPFILTSPSIKEKIEISEYVRTIDIMPTIMDFLNIPSSVPLRGKSLLPIIQDPSKKMNLPIAAMQYKQNIPPIPSYKTIIKDGYKFIQKESSQELYDLNSDPKELLNLNGKKRDISNALSNDLQELLDDTQYIYKSVPLNLNLDEDKKENLRSLGY